MIQFFEGLSGGGFHVSKVHKYAAFIQGLAPQNHLNLPVVPVEILTLPAKASQAVGGSKTAAYLHLKKPFAQSWTSFPVPGMNNRNPPLAIKDRRMRSIPEKALLINELKNLPEGFPFVKLNPGTI
jgi:hypothetical protein